MPTERFYRLSEEKKKKIREAALDEFTWVPLDKASINQIIKKAGISRGSFYTYFENKWDILNYLLEGYMEEIYDCSLKCLEESGGDIWKMLESLLESSVEFCREEKKIAFIKNLLNSPEQKEVLQQFWGNDLGKQGLLQKSGLERKTYEACAGVTLREMEIDEFCAFFQIAMFSVWIEVRNFFMGAPYCLVKKRFRAKEKVLKQGVSPGSRKQGEKYRPADAVVLV